MIQKFARRTPTDLMRISVSAPLWRSVKRAWCLLCFLPAAGLAADIKIAGSDLLGPGFDGALKAFAKTADQTLVADFSGSRAALDQFSADKADIAIVALAPDEKLPGGNATAHPLAYRIAVIAAPQAIEVSQITFTQLDGFFGVSGPAGCSLWQDLGVTGNAGRLSVGTHVLLESEDGLSADIFARLVLGVPRLKPAVQRHATFAGLKDRLITEEGGLAILSAVPAAGTGLRALMVAKASGEPAFGPTPENVHTGDYPLRLPIYVIYRNEAAPKLRGVLAFLWSDAAARALSEASLCVPVPPSGRPRIP